MSLRVVLMALLSILSLNGCADDAAVGAANQQQGNSIIKAINAFKADNGRYPASLSQLIPKYIQALPVPKDCENGWEYEADTKGEIFTLGFTGVGSAYTANFSSRDGVWITDTK